MIPEPAFARPARGLHAIVADDDEDTLALVSSALRRAGFEVHEAVNGNEVVAAFEAHATALTVVVSDIGMPECDGIAATIAMRKLEPSALIVLVTAFVDPATVVAAREAGVAQLLQKPLDLEALVETARSLLARR